MSVYPTSHQKINLEEGGGGGLSPSSGLIQSGFRLAAVPLASKGSIFKGAKRGC